MSNSKTYTLKRQQCERMVLAGEKDKAKLSKIFEVKVSTIETWFRKYGWNALEQSLFDIEKEIKIEAAKALLGMLKLYNKDPEGYKDVQSLRGMLKEFLDKDNPSKLYIEHALEYHEQFKEFCTINNLKELWEEYSKIGADFMEYIRVKNG